MSITLILVIITTGISIYAWSNPAMLNKWMFNPYMVAHRNQYGRFISSGFIHANWMHLLFNMFVFYMFGEQVEYVFQALLGDFGIALYVIMYLAAIVISDIPTFIKNKNNIHYNALGASGGTSGILFSYILFDPTQSLCLYGLLCLPGFMWGILYIIYSLYMSKQKMDNINHEAHLWGAIVGMGFTIVVYPQVVPHFFKTILGFIGVV